MNQTNDTWKQQLDLCLYEYNYEASPRGMKVRERLPGSYSVPMPAFISLLDRKVNYSFMFAEAAWIVSGSNRYSFIEPYMRRYVDFSDDGVFLSGAYGPKVVDQLKYVVDCLESDRDSRQAVINIWRERPGPSKDIPCTLSMQFLIRDGHLQLVTTMRSHDVVLGFTYDVFTFSMVASAVKLLLAARGIEVALGNLHVTAGSLHLYENQLENAKLYIESDDSVNQEIELKVSQLETQVFSYEDLIQELNKLADTWRKIK